MNAHMIFGGEKESEGVHKMEKAFSIQSPNFLLKYVIFPCRVFTSFYSYHMLVRENSVRKVGPSGVPIS